MRTDGANRNDQTLRPLPHDTLVHRDAAVLAPALVLILGDHHLEPSPLQALTELHLLEAVLRRPHEAIRLVVEDLVHEVHLGA